MPVTDVLRKRMCCVPQMRCELANWSSGDCPSCSGAELDGA
jgi:hypothetical protein